MFWIGLGVGAVLAVAADAVWTVFLIRREREEDRQYCILREHMKPIGERRLDNEV